MEVARISKVLSCSLDAAPPLWTNISLLAQHPDPLSDIKHLLRLDEMTLRSRPPAHN